MQQIVSKSEFNPKALAYLRNVQATKRPLTITHGRKPLVQIEPVVAKDQDKEPLTRSRGTVVSFKDPIEPFGGRMGGDTAVVVLDTHVLVWWVGEPEKRFRSPYFSRAIVAKEVCKVKLI